MSEVRLERVWKRYDGDVVAVQDLSLHIPDGELLVLLGPSGCGKSTTLRMVAGLEEATEGDLYIGDRRVNDVAPRDRDIAMVFQSYALYPHMTVFENMAFGLRIRKLARPEIEARVRTAAATLGLSELLHRKPRALSGGQRQRVAMGRAIVRNPQVFLFDEPLSNLDAQLRLSMRLEIARLHQQLEATTLYVTHDQVEAMTLADRIAILHEGKLQQLGSPTEVYNSPANRFVAGFIGSPAMNFLSGAVKQTGVELSFRGRDYQIPLPPNANHVFELGVRPHNLQWVKDGGIPARIELVECLGSETYVYFTWDEQQIVARVPSEHTIRAGEVLHFNIDQNAIHSFNANGEAV